MAFCIRYPRICISKKRISVETWNSKQPRLFSSTIDLSEFSEDDFTGFQPIEDTEDRGQPWKNLLSIPARCSWRVSETSNTVSGAVEEILKRSGITRKQLQKSHEAVLEQHRLLSLQKERERQRAIAKNMGSSSSMATRKEDRQQQPVIYGRHECFADFYYRSVPHFFVVKRILEESKSLLGRNNFQPRRVLDFGIGCGSASAAALDQFGESIEWIHGIDPSHVMRQAAEQFLTSLTQDNQTSISSLRTTFSSQLTSESSAQPKFDLAVCAFTALELPDTASCLAAAAILWEKLQPGGLFVMVEPGTPTGFLTIRTVRSLIIDASLDEKETHCSVVAPCTHSGTCPMDNIVALENRLYKPKRTISAKQGLDEESLTRTGYCSFVQNLPIGGDKKEKFSYIVLQKRTNGDSDHDSFEDTDLSQLLEKTLETHSSTKMNVGPEDSATTGLFDTAVAIEERFLDSDEDSLGLELLRGATKRKSYGRIVHAPKKRKGHILIDTCVAPGQLKRSTITKAMSKAAPGLYSAAKRSRWGGLWPNIQPGNET